MDLTPKNTLDVIQKRFGLSAFCKDEELPIEIPNRTRYSLAYLFNDLGFKEGAEIGVETGGYSEWIFKHCEGVRLHCIDPWLAYPGYRTHVPQEQQDSFFAETRKRLLPFNCNIMRKFSLEAVREFDDESLDFVFIDGNHDFINCANDIHEWQKKVKIGGIVAGHDYVRLYNYTEMHVAAVVDAYTEAYRIKPWFIFGLKEQRDGYVRDIPRTWMWVKDVLLKVRIKRGR
jgi:hypothetical protein